MSADLSDEIRVGLEELATVRRQLSPLITKSPESAAGDMETAAACAMLHSFYTEIEKMLRLIARDWDRTVPSSEAWHKELLKQMAASTDTRPAVIASDLVPVLSEFLAFRHLFRGASIALMRWNKLAPLVAKVDSTHLQVVKALELFREFLKSGSAGAQSR